MAIFDKIIIFFYIFFSKLFHHFFPFFLPFLLICGWRTHPHTSFLNHSWTQSISSFFLPKVEYGIFLFKVMQ